MTSTSAGWPSTTSPVTWTPAAEAFFTAASWIVRAFNEAVYTIAPERGHAALPRERLIQLAGTAGVPDLKKFEADLDSAELKNAVAKDAQEAAGLGATGTPIFLVNDTPIVGAQPLATFERAIDDALKSARNR
ncbi:DsbA family protein [uncultured Arthrobacter sp.]|uniref:DsbA family protein n=1 Tax=uncultured Arthrobacter sp. TaxID=114050 RepID=UPI003217EBA9